MVAVAEYYLPSKISSYLKRLLEQYKHDGEEKYAAILSQSKFFIQEAVSYDGWDGGQEGHNVKFFLPIDLIPKLIPIQKQSKIASKLLDDLRACASHTPGEYISQILFEVEDEEDIECQKAIQLTSKPHISLDSLSIWELGRIRLFISHRDKYKAQANELATLLATYGISAFVAHDSIEPMEKWQTTILKGLDTMEIMLAFVTDDFHDSYWTNQEIGYALARNIPVISLKLQKNDPAGFISEKQALRGSLDNLNHSITELYDVLANKLGNQSRMQTALIEAFATSPDWNETTDRFNRLKKHINKLNETEVERIISAFKENDQLHNAAYLVNHYQRLKKFLESTTEEKFLIEENIILRDTPF